MRARGEARRTMSQTAFIGRCMQPGPRLDRADRDVEILTLERLDDLRRLDPRAQQVSARQFSPAVPDADGRELEASFQQAVQHDLAVATGPDQVDHLNTR